MDILTSIIVFLTLIFVWVVFKKEMESFKKIEKFDENIKSPSDYLTIAGI